MNVASLLSNSDPPPRRPQPAPPQPPPPAPAPSQPLPQPQSQAQYPPRYQQQQQQQQAPALPQHLPPPQVPHHHPYSSAYPAYYPSPPPLPPIHHDRYPALDGGPPRDRDRERERERERDMWPQPSAHYPDPFYSHSRPYDPSPSHRRSHSHSQSHQHPHPQSHPHPHSHSQDALPPLVPHPAMGISAILDSSPSDGVVVGPAPGQHTRTTSPVRLKPERPSSPPHHHHHHLPPLTTSPTLKSRRPPAPNVAGPAPRSRGRQPAGPEPSISSRAPVMPPNTARPPKRPTSQHSSQGPPVPQIFHQAVLSKDEGKVFRDREREQRDRDRDRERERDRDRDRDRDREREMRESREKDMAAPYHHHHPSTSTHPSPSPSLAHATPVQRHLRPAYDHFDSAPSSSRRPTVAGSSASVNPSANPNAAKLPSVLSQGDIPRIGSEPNTSAQVALLSSRPTVIHHAHAHAHNHAHIHPHPHPHTHPHAHSGTHAHQHQHHHVHAHSHPHVHGHSHPHVHAHIHHAHVHAPSGASVRGSSAVPDLSVTRHHPHRSMGNIHYSANSASVPHYATYPPPPSLGTFVYPNSPFPLDITPTLPNQSASIPTYSLTIYIPAAQLLTSIPTVVPLWGSQDTSGDGDVAGGYTDDSDIRLAVLHAAFVSLDEMRRAKKEERDLKVEFVWRGVRTRFRGSVGGVGRRAGAKRAWSEDAEGVVRSAGWGTSHDGGALEIVRTEWVEKGTAYALHRPNRKSRIAQYTQQRARLNLLPPQPPSLADPPAINALPPFPSSAFRSGSPSSVSSSLVATPRDVSAGPVEMDLEDGEREGAMLNVVFGYGAEEGASFAYEPISLQAIAFGEKFAHGSNGRPRKKRRMDPVVEESQQKRSVVFENDEERFMLTPASSEDRYTLSVLSAPLSTQQVSKADVGFTDEGVCFWSSTSADHEGGDNDAIARKLGGARHRDGQRTGWFCTVKRWRFATAQEVEAAASNSSDSS